MLRASRESVRRLTSAVAIHGGPQSAWNDSWSTRWNPVLFASFGYIVVAIDPSGSTGYGQAFTAAVDQKCVQRRVATLTALAGEARRSRISLPVRRLSDRLLMRAGVGFVQRTFPEIDSDRMVAAGGSYGGYMINWLQGHNTLGFKAFVCHDGVFDPAQVRAC